MWVRVSFSVRRYLVSRDHKGMRDSIFKGIVLFLMADREVETDGIAIRTEPFR